MRAFFTRKTSQKTIPKAELLAKIEKDEDPDFTEFVYTQWVRADKNNSGTLSKNELKSLLRKINIEFKEQEFEAYFKRMDADDSGKLDFVEFRNFLRDLRERKEILPLFNAYNKGKMFLSKDDFIEFLQKEQKEKVTGDSLNKLLAALPIVDKNKLGFVAFSSYIASRENSFYNPDHSSKVYQDMKLPLPYYYIASSHNTYLTGHQLQGESTEKQYKYVLETGCRCVEIDCWDGDDGEPVVTHGHTVVSKAKFEDVIKVIAESAFVESEYPVILSLENHCGEEQQIKMAKILKKYLKDSLAKPFVDPKKLPSPYDLRRKFVIKGKKLKKDGADDVSGEDEEEEDCLEEEDASSKGKAPSEEKITIRKSDEKVKSPRADKTEPPKKSGKKAHPLAKELSDITHLNSARFGGFEKDKDLNSWDMCSNSELKVHKFYKQFPNEFIKHNVNFLTRTYPKGTRFDSSNYSPVEGWALGCHMVALNYQTGDPAMFVNIGKFLDNGKCGYVLKPPAILLNEKAEISPVTITLKVLSGWQLPKVSGTSKGEVIDPYVKVEIIGVGSDRNYDKTKVVHNNGYNPQWNTEMKFKIERPDLAHILISVFDEDLISKNDFIAYSSLPITSLREGYRSVILYNSASLRVNESSLLIHVDIEGNIGRKNSVLTASLSK